MDNILQEIAAQYQDVKPAYNRIYLTLRDAIQAGVFTSDRKVTEEYLAATLDVSRTPLRRAMEQLRNEGLLVSLKAAKSPQNVLPRREMEALLNCNLLLQPQIARLAANQDQRPEDLELLKELNHQLQAIAESLPDEDDWKEKDMIAVRDLHLQFHLLLSKMSKNKILYQTSSDTNMKLRSFRANDKVAKLIRPRQHFLHFSVPIHNAIIMALEQHDGETAHNVLYTELYMNRIAFTESIQNNMYE